MLCSIVLMVANDDGFFLFGLVTANPESLPVGEVCGRRVELERGMFTWHCFIVTSLNGVVPPLAAVAVNGTYINIIYALTKTLEYG